MLVGAVMDDVRLYEVPQGLKVCAMRFSDTARARIVKNGGECLTFDQLALLRPTGTNCVSSHFIGGSTAFDLRPAHGSCPSSSCPACAST